MTNLRHDKGGTPHDHTGTTGGGYWLISHPDPGLRIAIRRSGFGWKWKVERESGGLLDTLAEGTALTRKRAKRKAEHESARIHRTSGTRRR